MTREQFLRQRQVAAHLKTVRVTVCPPRQEAGSDPIHDLVARRSRRGRRARKDSQLDRVEGPRSDDSCSTL
jgi:hypothetical protein